MRFPSEFPEVTEIIEIHGSQLPGVNETPARNMALNELTRRIRHNTQAVADIDSLTVLVAEREQHDGPVAKAAINLR